MMARQKHVPQRTCIVCRTVKDKRDLLRIVRTPEGQIIVDGTGKANGRGAYLCRQVACWETGLRDKRLARALKADISAEVRDELLSQIATMVNVSV